MGTELRDVVMGLMGVLDLSAPFLRRGRSCERPQVEVRTLQAESTLISLCFSSASETSASVLANRLNLTGNPDSLIKKPQRQIPSICLGSELLFRTLITGSFNRPQNKVSVVERMTQHLFWFL